MRIVGAALYRQFQPFQDGSYTCRGQTETGFDSSIVCLRAEDGTTGWGEAAPLGAFYAEAFPEQIQAGLQRLLPMVLNADARAPRKLRALLDKAMFGQPAVKAALDMAAWDLHARLAKMSLAAVLGGAYDGEILLYRSIGQAAPDIMAAQASSLIAQGYRRLQVKVGADPCEDIERLKAVRAAVPRDIPLYADANGGWTLEAAMRFVDQTRALEYWLEQPCMTLSDNVMIARSCSKPIVLDEGITSPQDLMAAYQAGSVSGVTLKIARLGGIGPTALVRDIAVSLGLKVTIEDTGGSTLNTAATAQMMASTPQESRAHTVDFMNWVTLQNADGMLRTEGGCLLAGDGAGLGVSARPDMMDLVASF